MRDNKPLVKVRRKRNLSKKVPESKQNLVEKSNLEQLKAFLQDSFHGTEDLKVDNIKIAEKEGLLVYIDSNINMDHLQIIFFNKQTNVMEPSHDITTKVGLLKYCDVMFGGSGYDIIQTHEECLDSLLEGKVVISIKGNNLMITVGVPNANYRQIAEPTSQTVIRGPKDSFTEAISVNKSLIRRRIKNKNLCFESLSIGNETKTVVNIGYIQGIADEKIIAEVRKRLNNINVSAIFESGNIEELISDKTVTVFPLALNTERPDQVAASLIEGKICILVDQTPFVLIVPAVFTDFFNSPEDYYNHYIISSFLRIVRYIAFMVVLIVPSAYVGILSFHQELIPTALLINIMAQREGVPFPAVVEVVIMEFTFEILREAGIRMPRAVGQTVSIVGALVIGQAAAQAGIISNIMVIIVALTATANFVSPVYSLSSTTRILRFFLIPISAILGLYGVLLALVVLVAHLVSLRSFGVPYLAPIAPFLLQDQKDVFIRAPYWSLTKRPSYLAVNERSKHEKTGSPTPPDMMGGSNQ